MTARGPTLASFPVYLHPIRRRWCVAAWCGSALGDFETPDGDAACIQTVESAGGIGRKPSQVEGSL